MLYCARKRYHLRHARRDDPLPAAAHLPTRWSAPPVASAPPGRCAQGMSTLRPCGLVRLLCTRRHPSQGDLCMRLQIVRPDAMTSSSARVAIGRDSTSIGEYLRVVTSLAGAQRQATSWLPPLRVVIEAHEQCPAARGGPPVCAKALHRRRVGFQAVLRPPASQPGDGGECTPVPHPAFRPPRSSKGELHAERATIAHRLAQLTSVCAAPAQPPLANGPRTALATLRPQRSYSELRWRSRRPVRHSRPPLAWSASWH